MGRYLYVFLSDINAKRLAQEGQKKMMEDLEVMVAERTVELSNRVSELEQRDQLNRFMGEMADMLQSCRSTRETLAVGIRMAIPSILPRRSGITNPTALAAPVDVGI